MVLHDPDNYVSVYDLRFGEERPRISWMDTENILKTSELPVGRQLRKDSPNE
jgi:hypothetical protein